MSDPSKKYYCVIRISSGEVLYHGRSVSKTAHALGMGTVWGTGETKEDALKDAKRLRNTQEDMRRARKNSNT